MTLYERIRKLRIDQKITQDELAHMMGYKDRSMITKIESGKVDISQTKVVEFAKALNTTPGYLMGWEDEINMIEKRKMIVIPDTEVFRKIMENMSYEDYVLVMEAFTRTETKMKEKGEL